MTQATEVFRPDRFAGLDLDAYHGAGRVFQHHIYLHLVAVPVVEELDGLLGPGELTGHLADREILQQRPNWGKQLGRGLWPALPLLMRAICRYSHGRSADGSLASLPPAGTEPCDE